MMRLSLPSGSLTCKPGSLAKSKPSAACHISRRDACATMLGLGLAAQIPTAQAKPEMNQETPDASSSMIQGMLKRTEEKREERKRERLLDYNKRNFGDYIKFEASDGKMRGMSDETRLAMEKWSKDNQ